MTTQLENDVAAVTDLPFEEHTGWASDAIRSIRQKHKVGAESVLEIAEIFATAKDRFGKSKAMFDLFVERVGMGPAYASKMVTIHKWHKNTFRQFLGSYPGTRILEMCDGYSTLYGLSEFTLGQLKDLNEKIENGEITRLSRSEIGKFLGKGKIGENKKILGVVTIDRDKFRGLDQETARAACSRLNKLLKSLKSLADHGVVFEFSDKDSSVQAVLEDLIKDCCGVADDMKLAA